MVRINQLSMPGGAGWWRRVAAAGAAGVLAAGLAVVAAGPAAAAGPPVLAFTPSPYDYGQVTVGQKASQTFTLANSGDSASGTVTITLTGAAAFTITADQCTGTSLGPRKSCTVAVRFAPTSAGTVTATLTATGEHATATDSLTGTGVSAAHLYWTNIRLGSSRRRQHSAATAPVLPIVPGQEALIDEVPS